MLRHTWIALLASTAPLCAAELVVESFDGTGPLSGRVPAVNLLSSASWNAGPIMMADGSVNDGNNTDQGASLDLGADFAFLPNQTYTFTVGWSALSNAVLFAGFSTVAQNVGAQMQTQPDNFAVRIRATSPDAGIAAWTRIGSTNTPTLGSPANPAGAGSTTLTITTNNLTDATFSVDGVPSVPVNLIGCRYLFIAYEDPTSGDSTTVFESLVFEGPPPVEPPPLVTISPASGLLRPGESVTLASGDLPIRYTLDGGDPTEDSPLYTAPITPSASGEIRARTFQGNAAGPVASAHFALVPADPPNILILVGEAIGFGDLSCYGSVSTSTPYLDKLAAQGSRFTGLSLAGPGSSSAPYALLTGRVPRRADLPDTVPAQQTGWERREWTLAEALRKTGYHTAFIGAWQLGSVSGSLPGDQGFALFHGLPWSPSLSPAPPLLENDITLDSAPDLSNLPAALADRAKNHLSAVQNGQPFLIVVHIPELPASGSSLLGPAGDRVEAFDACAGEILDHLDQLGLTDDTLTMFLSSYTANRTSPGPSLGSNAPFRDGAGSTWEGGLRVPAIARWPGVIPSATDNLAALWLPDLFPSLLAIGRGQAPSARPLDGQPRPEILLSARTRTAPGMPMFHHRRNGATHLIPALRSGLWKLHLSINNTDPQNPAGGPLPRLHHLEIDPYERINLASAQPGLVTALQAALAGHEATFAAAVPQLPPPAPPFIGEPASSILPDGSIAWTFHRPAESLDDRYLVEFSTNLIDWSAEPIHPFIESTVPHDNDIETLTLRIPRDHPLLTGPRSFVRLRSEHP